MGKTVSVEVTPQGVLLPRTLVSTWGEVHEVEIEQYADTLIVKPKAHDTRRTHTEIVHEMKAAGLIEDLPWAQPPAVPAAERARLAKKLGVGQPLSEIIIAERESRS